LLGGRCPDCKSSFFPKPRYCPKCLGLAEETVVGDRGTIYSMTVVRTKPPLGLPQPYAVGYVDMEGVGLRVFCLLDPGRIDAFRAGSKVKLAMGLLGHDGKGEPRTRPYFTPIESD
jgi:uncharacterized protein